MEDEKKENGKQDSEKRGGSLFDDDYSAKKRGASAGNGLEPSKSFFDDGYAAKKRAMDAAPRRAPDCGELAGAVLFAVLFVYLSARFALRVLAVEIPDGTTESATFYLFSRFGILLLIELVAWRLSVKIKYVNLLYLGTFIATIGFFLWPGLELMWL
ncbi:MAG: hypothetical protein IJM30_08470 [Thermoguttaceae bacterium]|nr:hypothetical protein [Thermoguttaceae bacterium]